MIRIHVLPKNQPHSIEDELNELKRLVENVAPGWLDGAEQRVARFEILGRYDSDEKGTWSEIKCVYSDLQGNRCAFCERELKDFHESGATEQDIEHFRPKGKVVAWKSENDEINEIITNKTRAGGYYLLPYHLQNYAMACKPCNQTLKKNFFPITGGRPLTESKDVTAYQMEHPLLIYPIGSLDDDPTAHLTFFGFKPVAKTIRGEAVIEIFHLDDEDLFRKRSMILLLANYLDDPDYETAFIERIEKGIPFQGCLIAYYETWKTNPDLARSILAEVEEYFLHSS